MAEASDLPGELMAVTEGKGLTHRDRERAKQKARRAEALSLRMSGFTYAQIAERLGISETGAHDLVLRTLERTTNVAVAELRDMENARLDRAQMAIWGDVLRGDHKAIGMYLRISSERSRLNGLYAPQKIDMSMSIRTEMEEAFKELEALVMEQPLDLEPVERNGEIVYEYGADTEAADESASGGDRPEAGEAEGTGQTGAL